MGVTSVRLVSAVVLRQYLLWLTSEKTGLVRPAWQGYLLAIALGSCAFSQAMINHQQPWYGALLGFLWRQQVLSAVHAKLMRLTGPAISAMSPGFIINLVSNDLRRFDDAAYYWLYLWCAPLELCCVFIMVSLELDALSAFAGISVLLLVIPLQGFLVQPVASIRRATAQCTDERVRLTGETIQGALACKLLCWEEPLAERLIALRKAEALQLGRMARIRAFNMSLQFMAAATVSFVTFAVYRARSGGSGLSIATVFYALSLLQLPRRTMNSFVSGVQAVTELRVSLTRYQHFFSAVEPPLPSVDLCIDRNLRDNGTDEGSGQAFSPGVAAERRRLPPGTVVLQEADYDWDHPFGRGVHMDWMSGALSDHDVQPGAARPAAGSTPTTAPGADASSSTSSTVLCMVHSHSADPLHTTGNKGKRPPQEGKGRKGDVDYGLGKSQGQEEAQPDEKQPCATLQGVRFRLRPGELLGVTGEVGSGKSTLLSALLQEVQPLQAETEGHSSVEGSLYGPIVIGSVAYCPQVPWIVSGSVKDNITFGSVWDEFFYKKVLVACALGPDIAALPAGDATELGERGINLSGGQKARVALARAAYSRPDVALLDDPLSAVDPHVGRVLFGQCIKDILKSSTCVLCTHQRHYLPQCDRVLVLRRGQMVALGTWQELLALGLPELTIKPGDDSSLDVDPAQGQSVADSADDVLPGQSIHNDTPFEAPNKSDGRSMELQPIAGSVADDPDTGDQQNGQGGGSNGLPYEHTIKWTTDGPAQGTIENGGGWGARLLAGSMRRFAWGRSSMRMGNGAGGYGSNGAELGAWPTQQAEQGEPEPTEETKLLSSVNSTEIRVGKGEAAAAAKAAAGAAAAKRGEITAAEGRAVGAVEWVVYGHYLKQVGLWNFSLVVFVALSAQVAYLAADWWLALWARAAPERQADISWLWVYGLLTFFVSVGGVTRSYLFFAAALRAATRLHLSMVANLLRAPLAWFHTQPTGRILNRFSKDQGSIDEQLANVAFDAMQCGLLVLGAVVLVLAAVPWVLLVFLPLAYAFLWIRRRYITASREVKRWEAVTRSPVYSSISSSLKGLSTIRAYGAQARFNQELLSELHANGQWSFCFTACGRWIGFRIDMIASIALLASALIACAVRSTVDASLLGLALSHMLQMTGVMQWFVRQTAEVENSMTATERCMEYTRLPREAPWVAEGGGTPPPGWPTCGALAWENLSAQYRPGLPLVLRNVTFSLKAGTSCGVVGRTGSGKSSLALALFRLIAVTAGRMLLDGVDVATIGVDALRRQLAIIPQDPVLFSGTLRSNLDPWGRHTDAALWQSLESVQMRRTVVACGGLGARMVEAGENLSVGQRQLFCLSRALLQQAQVLVLDEATANVDRETDKLIQGSLETFVSVPPASGAHTTSTALSACGSRVLLVIAHRIETIMNSDHLLVLGAGRLMEQGPPHHLAALEGGVFASMVVAAAAATTPAHH